MKLKQKKVSILLILLVLIPISSMILNIKAVDPPISTSPKVNILNPQHLSGLKGTIKIRVNAWDDETTISKVQCKIEKTSFSKIDSSAPYEFSWNTKTVADGAYNIVCTAYDKDVPIKRSASKKITVVVCNNDKTKPTIKIVYPKNKEKVEGVVNFRVDVSDNLGVKKLKCFINDKLYTVSGTNGKYSKLGSLFWVWDARNYQPKEYTIKCQVIDYAGNSASTSIKVKLEPKPPSGKIIYPMNHQEFEANSAFTLSLYASDNVGLRGIDVYFDNMCYFRVRHSKIKSCYYNVRIRIPKFIRPGGHLITVIAYDSVGCANIARVWITVSYFYDPYY